MKRKLKTLLMILCFAVAIFVLQNKVLATDTTEKLYQDITINEDGSITVKEATVLQGKYNGRDRRINFSSYSSVKFTGMYSNFAGQTDIYNGTSIENIKIADISQKNFNSFNDIYNIENVYKKVESASKGKYGVYTLDETSIGANFKIFCPSSKKKVFYMEYTITDAVVIHNDIAELYWNVLGESYRENISDFRVIVHLPEKDEDFRVWSHGPLTGTNSIIDKETVSLVDYDVPAYTAETIRIMFNKDLVPYATKKSGVNGRENILKYEQTQADTANAKRENAKLEAINYASQKILDLQNEPNIYNYNRAVEYISRISYNFEEKEEYLKIIENFKPIVNENWKKEIEKRIDELSNIYVKVSKSKLKRIEEEIELGFDEEQKILYKEKLYPFYEEIEIREAETRRTSMIVTLAFYMVPVFIMIIYILKKVIEGKSYKQKYYRDFPNEDEPGVIEYLMKGKVTNISISATILDLVAKKVIKLEEENVNNKKEIVFTRINSKYKVTPLEQIVLDILFKLVGNRNDRCTLKELKKYGKDQNNAKRLNKKIEKFKKIVQTQIDIKAYFKKSNLHKIMKVYTVIQLVFGIIMSFGIFYERASFTNVILYLLFVSAFGYIFGKITTQKQRTQIGSMEYSKWLAHKRFLKDFSKFDEKNLPEIALWDKYLVTATVLGCADRVQKSMKLHITNMDESDIYNTMLFSYSTGKIIDNIRVIERTLSTSETMERIANSTSSSGDGYGGGSSDFGGGGGRWRRRRSFLNKDNYITNLASRYLYSTSYIFYYYIKKPPIHRGFYLLPENSFIGCF